MKLIVGQHKIEIEKTPVNEKELNVTEIEFEFDEAITNNYVKEAYFTLNNNTYKKIIVNNKCGIPSEVLTQEGQVEIGVVAYLVENEEEIKRYNPSPVFIKTWEGSLKNAQNTEPITPSEMEQFEQALNDGLNEVANVDIDAEQLDNGMSVTITNRYGEDKTVYAYDGEKGETGATPNIQIGTVVTGDHSAVTRTGTNENPIFNFILEKGDKGDTGNGIANVTKTATSGLVDTYTITYTNGTTTTFDVTNGKGITNIAKTSTSGLEDTYTITYNDNTTSTFTVTNGNGISSIKKTGTQDNVDTYTIYYTNGTTSTFTVTNSTVTNQQFEELKAEHEELVNTLPRVEGTGESITLDNTAQYNMNVALNPSELSQTTYTGKNLLSPKNVSGYNGITITPIQDKNNNIMYFHVEGTATGDMGLQIADAIVSANTNYFESGCPSGGSSSTYYFDIYTYTGNTYVTGYKDYGSGKVFTTNNENNIKIYLNVKSGTTVNFDVKPQLELGNSKTSFEPYVGGVPSPNPSYPQPIKKVTGNNSLKVVNKNLFNVNEIYSSNSASYSVTNNNLTVKCTKDNSNCYVSYRIYNINKNTAYNFSYTAVADNFSAYSIRAYSSDGTYTSLKDITVTTNENTSFTTPNNVSYLMIYLYSSRNNSSGSIGDKTTYSNIQIELGSTKTSYEPYQSQTYPINLGSLEYCKIGNYSDSFLLSTGKNLLPYPYNVTSQTLNGVTYTINGDGTITAKGTSTAIAYLSLFPNQNGKRISFGSGTYTFSVNNISSGITVQIGFRDSEGNSIGVDGVILTGTNNIATRTIGQNFEAFCNLEIQGGKSIDTVIEIQIEAGTSATSYEPYGIGNWYLKKNIGKVVLDENGTWSKQTGYYQCITNLGAVGGRGLCNYYIYGSTSTPNSFWVTANAFRTNDATDTLENYKIWLSTHNIDLYYVMGNPTSEQITDTTLIEQLNNLYNQIKSYKGQTNITQTNAELPFNIDASALYDLNNLISRVATLEVEV